MRGKAPNREFKADLISITLATTICSSYMKIQSLSELELEVMNIVWKTNPCSVRDILKIISRKKNLAYTTIGTVLARLYAKRMVAKDEESLAILYSPKISKLEYSKSISGSFFHSFFQSFGDAAIASFAESIDELPKNKKKYFIELLKNQHEIK